MLDYYDILQANSPQQFWISTIILTDFRMGIIRECPQMDGWEGGGCKKIPLS